MENLPMIIGGIISLVSIIVFFVMASNISKLLTEVRYQRKILYRMADKDNLLTKVKCSRCDTVFNTAEDNYSPCPKCHTLIKVEAHKID